MSGYSHILLAVDFSDNADAVAQRALQLGAAFSCRLSLVHVVEFVQVDLSNELVLPQELELDQELLKTAQRRLQTFAAKLGIEDCQQFVVQGSTRREILRIAEEHGVDLIVVGSHGRQGIQLLLGSTSNAVLHGAPCDVLAVRVKD
ncbi:MAG: universal stress protein [Thiogranum sp.]|nr:universal stress protein [Thiogranum sp.]